MMGAVFSWWGCHHLLSIPPKFLSIITHQELARPQVVPKVMNVDGKGRNLHTQYAYYKLCSEYILIYGHYSESWAQCIWHHTEASAQH